MPVIVISGTPIVFPDSGSPENWAPAVIAFAEATAAAIEGNAGPSDVSPQTYVIDNFNPGTNISIPNLVFSTTTVQGAFINYALYRSTNATSAYETGTMQIAHNPNGSTGQKWELTQQFTGGGSISFNITDTGQMQFSTIALTGLSHTGRLSYSAKALLLND